jgi:spermidine synthase
VALLLPHPEVKKVIYETETQYDQIRVEEGETGMRYLVFLPDNGYQSVFDPSEPDKLVSDYVKYTFMALPALGRTPENALFVGMGGGIMSTYFRKHYPHAVIDTVEIDGAIPAIAEKYFGFAPDSKTHVFVEDGYSFIKNSKKKYDLVFLDIYDAETMPEQFRTTEFFKSVKNILNDDGVLSINLANLGDKFVNTTLDNLTSAFPATYVFLTERKTNYVPISCANNKVTLSDIANNSKIIDNFNSFNINFLNLLNDSVPVPVRK